MEKDASRVGFATVRTYRQTLRGSKDERMKKRPNRTDEKRELPSLLDKFERKFESGPRSLS